jgi:hypothetical protein
VANYTAEQIAGYSSADLARSIFIDRPDGTREYLFIPTDVQAEIMGATEPNLFVVGSRGGGKSLCMRWLCHSLALSIPNFRYTILRTSFPELMKNHLIYVEEEMAAFGGESAGFVYHKTDHIAYYPNGSRGFFNQCATDADVKKILGAEVALIVFDEAPTFQWEHMRLIAASVRVTKTSGIRPMVRYLGNPVGESIEELYRYFIDKDVTPEQDSEYRPEDWRTIWIGLADNPHLDAEQYRRQFAGLPEHYRKAWIEGVRMEERTLFRFRQKLDGRSYHVVEQVPTAVASETPWVSRKPGTVTQWQVAPGVRVYRAIDWGFFPDPAVCLWFAVYGKRLLCFKEKVYYRTLAEDMAKDIVAESEGLSVIATYCDPTMDRATGADIVSIRDVMEQHGVPLEPSVNDRELFAFAIHNALQREVEPGMPRIQFLAAGCPYLIKNLPRMKWSERNPNAMAEHKHDHPVVTLAYFLMSAIPESMASIAPTRVRAWMLPKAAARKRVRPAIR